MSFALTGSLLVLTGYLDSKVYAAVAISASITCSAIGSGDVNYVDISPHYVGILYAIGNTISNVAGIAAPIVAGRLLGDLRAA